MEARIAIQPNGKISVFVDAGVTPAEAKKLSNALLEKLGADLDIDIIIAPPEQHRHGPGYEYQHVGEHTHAGGTPHTH